MSSSSSFPYFEKLVDILFHQSVDIIWIIHKYLFPNIICSFVCEHDPEHQDDQDDQKLSYYSINFYSFLTDRLLTYSNKEFSRIKMGKWHQGSKNFIFYISKIGFKFGRYIISSIQPNFQTKKIDGIHQFENILIKILNNPSNLKNISDFWYHTIREDRQRKNSLQILTDHDFISIDFKENVTMVSRTPRYFDLIDNITDQVYILPRFGDGVLRYQNMEKFVNNEYEQVHFKDTTKPEIMSVRPSDSYVVISNQFYFKYTNNNQINIYDIIDLNINKHKINKRNINNKRFIACGAVDWDNGGIWILEYILKNREFFLSEYLVEMYPERKIIYKTHRIRYRDFDHLDHDPEHQYRISEDLFCFSFAKHLAIYSLHSRDWIYKWEKSPNCSKFICCLD